MKTKKHMDPQQFSKKKLLHKLEEINIAINQNQKDELNVGTLVGKMGLSIFKFHYSNVLEEKKIAQEAIELIFECFELINNEATISTNYCSGLAGFGWGIDYLAKEDFIDLNPDKILSELDDSMELKMKSEIKEGNYDFLHGALGYAFYFLSRFQNSKNNKLKKKYSYILQTFLDDLQEISVQDSDGIKWKNSWNKSNNDIVNYDLGMAHGLSSILNFLSRLYVYPEFGAKSKKLLLGGIRFLMKNQNTDTKFCFFPNSTNESSIFKRSRVAWCYGDLGIGYSLFICSKVLKDEKLKTFALNVLRETSQRKKDNDTLVVDAGICHGSFGNMIIFKRLFEYTNDKMYYASYRYWGNKGISMSTHKDGLAGYKSYWGGSNVWKNEISLLEGVSGIGLSIIDLLLKKRIQWNSCILID